MFEYSCNKGFFTKLMYYDRNFYQIKQNGEIFSSLQKEIEYVGYFKLPFQDTSKIKLYAETVKQTNIFVIGIGGSSLGSKAIYKFLKTSNQKLKQLIFLDTIDPLEINYLLAMANLEDSHFVLISKSGNTVEPISIFKYLSSKINIDKNNTTVIAGESSKLHNFAKNNRLKFFSVPKDVGGRFSVFSAVGLVPLCMSGINIDELLKGARKVHESFFNKDFYYDHIINKARFLVENKSRFSNNIIFSYSSVFSDFNKWYVQIWAESLGKKNQNGTRQGLTPIALLGPDDQHSFLQLIMDGVRDKTVTFFKINNLKDDSLIPSDPKFKEFDLDCIDNKSFNELINYQADATYEAILAEKDIPCDIITIDSVDEENIAMLMYRFQLLVSCVGSFLQINSYDQPAVELGKNILFRKLKS